MGSSSPYMASVLRFWFNLALVNIEHRRRCLAQGIDYFPSIFIGGLYIRVQRDFLVELESQIC